ncbi:hypothetical protein ANACOL_03909 [Anaerotruncus colihominis DSM 17241]|uniref:Uncharacterized protein n=1 Tax=Anaerotruncus colihominis DSM 17241 TaxID=445972 RepID=B0PGP1_9FIRM|nr:hypothetical protein ANACOL_03909 [Anaerotruncus colihominis DSM 17241]
MVKNTKKAVELIRRYGIITAKRLLYRGCAQRLAACAATAF